MEAEGWEVVGYFYNPNVHPLLEFRRRVKALRVFAETKPVDLVVCEAYGLREFLTEVAFDRPRRCVDCYELRLRSAARQAQAQNCDAFSSTLLVSPMQRHDDIRTVGERIAADTGVPFCYRDFRPLYEMSIESARKKRLYRQPYCGCVFSEQERYEETTRHLYKGAVETPRDR